MKKLILMTVGLLSLLTAQAQERVEKKEKIEAMKVAYITKELDLTAEEAQKFWPIYNAREAELQAVRKQMHHPAGEKKLEDMTDAEIEKMIQDQIALKQKELDIEKTYHAKFKEVLSIKKIALLYKAEREFKREVMRQWKEKNGEHHKENPNKKDKE